jgi:hypothetical protein
MTAARDTLVARAAKVAVHPDVEQPAARPIRARPVRITVDLAPQTHRTLRESGRDIADGLGQVAISHAAIVRALIAELDANPNLRNVVMRRLREDLT